MNAAKKNVHVYNFVIWLSCTVRKFRLVQDQLLAFPARTAQRRDVAKAMQDLFGDKP